MENIKIESKFADKEGEIMIVELGGHVDQSNSHQLQKMFDDIIESGVYKVVVDFNSLHYMSSAGWGIFVGEVKRFRENGGDIKLAAMNPEINDVYQMLEFYHILEEYTTVNEAAESFKQDNEMLDLVGENTSEIISLDEMPSNSEESEEIDLSEKSDTPKKPRKKEAEVIEMIPSSTQKPDQTKTGEEFIPHSLKSNVKLSDLPVAEKVKRIISENPLVNVFEIKKILKHEHFGYTKIGIFRLIRLLKDLDLNSRAKRYRYYRSC